MNIWLLKKTLLDRMRGTIAWTIAMVALTTIQLYVYPTVKESGAAMDEFLKAFPKEMIAMFRIEDYTSSVGFLGTELFSMMIPLVFIALGASWGAAIAAEEEEKGTSELIYTLPITRTSVVLSKLAALWIVLVSVGLFEIIYLTIGSGFVGLDLNGVQLVPATLSCLSLGLFTSAVAFSSGTIFGRRGAALGLAIAVALISFLIFSLAPMVDTFDTILPGIPFQWALGGNPLKKGFDVVGVAKLVTGSAILYVIGVIAINRRDLDS